MFAGLRQATCWQSMQTLSMNRSVTAVLCVPLLPINQFAVPQVVIVGIALLLPQINEYNLTYPRSADGTLNSDDFAKWPPLKWITINAANVREALLGY
jgi:hypothetical protein